MRSKIKLPTGWSELHDSEFIKHFGPISVNVRREWPVASNRPTEFRAYLSAGYGRADLGVVAVRVSEIKGLEWFDEEFDPAMLREMNKRVKALIRSWTTAPKKPEAKPTAPSGLFRITAGTRVRFHFGGTPHYGTATAIDGPVPWVTVKWDAPVFGLKDKFMPGELENPDAPLPKAANATDAPF